MVNKDLYELVWYTILIAILQNDVLQVWLVSW